MPSRHKAPTATQALPRYDDLRRSVLIEDCIQAVVDGDVRALRSRLGLCINATLGFDALSSVMQVPVGTLKQMVSFNGKISADQLLTILRAVQHGSGVCARVEVIDDDAP